MPRATSVASRSKGSSQRRLLWALATLLSRVSASEPRGTHSSTRHKRDSPQHAPMKDTTLGWRRVAVIKISARNAFMLSEVTFRIVFTATGCPIKEPLKTSPKAPAPTRFSIFTSSALSKSCFRARSLRAGSESLSAVAPPSAVLDDATTTSSIPCSASACPSFSGVPSITSYTIFSSPAVSWWRHFFFASSRRNRRVLVRKIMRTMAPLQHTRAVPIKRSFTPSSRPTSMARAAPYVRRVPYWAT
mmetsp:Transcript_21980/g.43299  ORF Transcript_21980/g.43299 Transcript_21980/m.43299 type:complete len:246 (-) Transcript_21980:472-1209(-)